MFSIEFLFFKCSPNTSCYTVGVDAMKEGEEISSMEVVLDVVHSLSSSANLDSSLLYCVGPDENGEFVCWSHFVTLVGYPELC